MANVYSDIAIRPDIAGYPLVNQQANGEAANDAADAAHFQQILDRLAAQAQAQNQGQTQPQAPVQGANFALTKASGWVPRSTAATASAAPEASTHSFKNFMKNVWDVVNPLQHIPVVGAIYRHVTGDTISSGAHFMGDALYGGPIGGAIAAIDIAYQKSTGKDMGETVIASLIGNHGSAAPASPVPDTMIAQNLTQITPAAGNAPANTRKNIIWSDNISTQQNIVSASTSPLFPPSGTIGEGSASPSPAQPVLQANSAASTGAVQTQEAPAGASRKAVPPELIASRMMEGLRKYAQMQQQALNPQLSGLY